MPAQAQEQRRGQTEEQTIDGLFQELFPVIRAKCARMLGDSEEAADIAQETFLRFCSSPVVGEAGPARLRWIYQTSTRLAIDHLRRRRLGVEVKVDDPVDAPQAGSGADTVLAARQWLRRLHDRLSAEEMEVLILSRFDRLTQDEVAEVTARSSRSVRRILVRVDDHIAALTRSLS